MFDVDDKNIIRLEKDLKLFAKKALPFATKNTVNSAAFQTQKTVKSGLRDDLILRNRFTEQSIRVDQTRTLDVRRQAAIVGSTADYMRTQELGGSEVKTGKQGKAIPTSYSSGEGDDTQPRRRLPRKPNKLENIRLRRLGSKGKSRQQKNLIAVKAAASSGNKYVYLDLGRRKGLFKVVGGKRKPRVKMVHDLTRKSVTIPKKPWLLPAVRRTERNVPELYRKSLLFQLRRRNILGY